MLIRLLAHRVEPYIVAKKVGLNVLELPSYGISSTFSVSDLIEFRAPEIIPSELFVPDPILVSEPILECPLNLLEREIGSSIPWMTEPYPRTKAISCLVHWQGRPKFVDSWTIKEDLPHIDPNLVDPNLWPTSD